MKNLFFIMAIALCAIACQPKGMTNASSVANDTVAIDSAVVDTVGAIAIADSIAD